MLDAENKQNKEVLVGVVDRILFKNQDNGYHVLEVEVDANAMKNITVTINHPNIFEGFTYEFTGEYQIHPKFGNQFKGITAQEVLPTTTEGIKAYLSSSFFPGIGPVIASRIINHFGDNVINIFNNEIDKLLTVPGISTRKLSAIKEAWEKKQGD